MRMMLDGKILQLANGHRRKGVEHPSDKPLFHFLFHARAQHGPGDIESYRGQIQLANFLLPAHLGHEGIYKPLSRSLSVYRRGSPCCQTGGYAQMQFHHQFK